jgi:hypothetical protein
MTQPDHYQSAEILLGMADQAAIRGRDYLDSDPNAALAALAGSAVSILAAQVHATLAVVDALRVRLPVNDGGGS